MKLLETTKKDGELITELSMKKLEDFVTSVKTTVKDEFNDNVEAFKVVKKMILSKLSHGDNVTDVEFKNLIEQLKDNFRIILMIGVGITPGSALTLPILIKIASKLGIKIIPTKTFNI